MPILEIARINLRHNTLLSLIVSAAIIMVTPIIFGIANLNQTESAIPLEMFVSLLGIVLFTPIFQPEQNHEIADVVFPKCVSMNVIYLIRAVYTFFFLIAFIALFGVFMRLQKSDVTFLMLIGTVANAVFLGSLGMLAAVLTDNTIVAYMIPMVYYMLNYGAGRKLGNFYLFSMRIPDYQPKIWLLTTGIFLIFVSLLIERFKKKMK